MRPFLVIMGDICCECMPQRPFPKQDEPRQGFLLDRALADLGQGLLVPISQTDAALERRTKDAIFRPQILVATQEFLIDRPGHIRQELLPPHGSCSLHH
jgi:hypothetical protein